MRSALSPFFSNKERPICTPSFPTISFVLLFLFRLNVFVLFFLSQAAGKYKQEGKNYVVNDGDIIFFKFNAGAGLTDKKKTK